MTTKVDCGTDIVDSKPSGISLSKVVSEKKEEIKETQLQKFKNVCHKWLHIEHDEFIDVLFGVVFANRLDAKPVWLYLVAPPGAGKTEIVQTWDGHKSIYALTTFTHNTLISGKILQPKEADPSLLPKLDGKVLVIKDFTVILNGRHDDITAIFGQLRDAYDGVSRAVFGTGKEIRYESKFGIIAAVTNEIDRHLRLVSSLGERFLVYRFPSLSEGETKARTLRAAESESAKEQEAELKIAAHQVLDLAIKPASISEELRERLSEVADFVAAGRTSVRRDRQMKGIVSLPQSEIPTRLVKQLVSLAIGIAMAREKGSVTEDEIQLVNKVAMGSIPPMRLTMLRYLKEAYPASLKIKELTDKTKLGDSVIRYCLEELEILKIVERSKENSSVLVPYDWKWQGKYRELLGRIGI